MPLITPGDPSARSHPWLTYLLAAALIAAFFVQRTAGEPAARRSAASIANATAYFEEHPTVELDPRFERVLGVDWVEGVRAAHRDGSGSADRPLLSGFLQRRTQKKFDELEHSALVELAELPIFRYGLGDRDTPVRNFALHVFIGESGLAFGVGLFFLIAAGAAVEFSWGMLLYSLLSVLSVGIAAAIATSLHTELSGPWVGTTGLVAGLIGGALVTSPRRPPLLFGALPLPGWLLLPAFIAAEGVRHHGLPPLSSAAVLAPAASAGFGLFCGLVIGLLRKPATAGKRRAGGKAPNPIVEQARRALAANQPDRAIDLLSKEFARQPKDCSVARSLWEAERDHGDPTRAVDAMLTLVRDHLRRGRSAELVACWMELIAVSPTVVAEAPLLIRVGQALLDEGHAEQALRALSAALGDPRPLSSALLLRVIRVARDLDAPLAQRAAELALTKADLGDTDRADLQKLVNASPTTDEAGNPLPRIRIVQKPATQVEREQAPAFEPWDRDVEDLSGELADDLSIPGSAQPAPTSWSDEDPVEAATRVVPAIDSHALDPHAIAADALRDEVSEAAPASPADMERWNDPSLIEAEGDDLDADTAGVGRPLAPAVAASPETDEAFNGVGDSRQLKLVSARLVSLEDAGLAIEVEDRGKIALAYEKIDALAVAAVRDLDTKPVLVIDLVLNWMSLRQESLRVIRLRSDQFDPRKLVAGSSSATEALRQLIGAILQASDATPLPDVDAANGKPFVEFATLTAYEQQVLMVDSSRDAASA